ncbi:hypothetical protein MMC14_007019 [Varicellaria rhodocarpa]|nr:hypothetical protein [Varicellaria rhodocarpa]
MSNIVTVFPVIGDKGTLVFIQRAEDPVRCPYLMGLYSLVLRNVFYLELGCRIDLGGVQVKPSAASGPSIFGDLFKFMGLDKEPDANGTPGAA